jgi:hypothetical protein
MLPMLQIQLGRMLVTTHSGQFMFQDVCYQNSNVTLDEADAAELILFLNHCSRRVAEELNIERLPHEYEQTKRGPAVARTS